MDSPDKSTLPGTHSNMIGIGMTGSSEGSTEKVVDGSSRA
jgi:hypothetical protein